MSSKVDFRLKNPKRCPNSSGLRWYLFSDFSKFMLFYMHFLRIISKISIWFSKIQMCSKLFSFLSFKFINYLFTDNYISTLKYSPFLISSKISFFPLVNRWWYFYLTFWPASFKFLRRGVSKGSLNFNSLMAEALFNGFSSVDFVFCLVILGINLTGLTRY